jgi:hypothetical protein
MLAFLQMTGDFEAPASLKLVLGAGFIVNGLFTLVLAGTKGGDEDN